jgi:hypothetical protein
MFAFSHPLNGMRKRWLFYFIQHLSPRVWEQQSRLAGAHGALKWAWAVAVGKGGGHNINFGWTHDIAPWQQLES